MKRLVAAWAAWVALWDRREPATAQAMVRIAVAVIVLVDLLDARRLGLIDAVWAPPPEGMGHGASRELWSTRWFGASAETAHLLWWVGTAAAVAVVLGLGTRLAALAFVLVSAQLAALAPDADRGIDGALRVVLLVLAFGYGHARWSLDAVIRRRLGRPFPAAVPAWPRYLLLAQVVWIYFSGGHNKTMPEWYPNGHFAALANALSDPHFARFGSGWVPAIFPLPQLATAVTMAFELGAPLVLLFLWFEATADRPGRLRRWSNRLRLRWVWIAIGVGFHLGIAVTLQLGIFPWGMLALYPVLLRAAELVAVEARLREWLARKG